MDFKLSKSSFQRGRQCLKRLYLSRNHPELKSPKRLVVQSLYDQGIEVGEIARELFPGGKNIENKDSKGQQLLDTTDAIAAGEQILYEAAFEIDGLYIASDILLKKDDTWHLYEVKSTSTIKESLIWDLAFQSYVLKKQGFENLKIHAVHINTSYRLRGSIIPEELFKIKDLTKLVRKLLPEVENIVNQSFKVLSEDKSPEIAIGPHCTKPHECEFMKHCWKDVPEQSVLELTHSTGKQWELYDEGIIHMKDIPDSFELSKTQIQQVDAWKTGEDIVDQKSLKTFLGSIEYPLIHLDFESFGTAIPLYQFTKPFQQIPFQYSIHIQESPGAEPSHLEFLAKAGNDPRRELLYKLLRDTEGRGTILAYNESFEKKILRDLAVLFPMEKMAIEQRISRIKDLIDPFRQFWYYTAKMNGSASIKKVLPALAPEFNYDSQEISDGAAASHAYLQLVKGESKGNEEQIKRDLLDYCTLDTLGMVHILNKLYQKAGML